MIPYYQDELVTIYHADVRELDNIDEHEFGCHIIDPPYDDPSLFEWAANLPRCESEIVFTDPRHLGDITSLFGPPVWVFTWDTMAPWTVGPRRPLTQTKFALWYGAMDEYDRDAVLWGDAPEAKDHPSTKQTPLNGRRLTDMWKESLRWLHHPGAGSGSAGTERFGSRQGNDVMRHAKPVGWVRCLIGNTSSGPVFDPFVGSGTTIEAAVSLGRQVVACDISEACCEMSASRCAQGVLFGDAA